MCNHKELFETLRCRVEDLQSDNRQWNQSISTGCKELDQLFGSGIERGALVEWIGAPGAGATTLAIATARAVCQESGSLVVVDRRRLFYPPAAEALGVDLLNTIVVQPTNKPDHQWCLIQTLRCSGVTAMVCWPERADERMLRKLQIAAERGGTLGFLVRPPSAAGAPSWARYRLLVKTCRSPELSRRWQVTLIKHQRPQHQIELELNDDTKHLQQARALPVASPVVTTTTLQGAS